MIFWDLLLILVLIGLNAFFVSVEFAAVASRRARLDVLAGTDNRSVRLVRVWLEDPTARDRLIAASQLGITVVSLALGAAGENTFEVILTPVFAQAQFPTALAFVNRIIPALPLALSLILVTSLHVTLGEQVPKVATLRAPERFALFAAPIMEAFTTIFKWFVNLLDWVTRQVLTLLGIPPSTSHSSVYSLEELRQIVSGPEVAAVIEQPEREMLSAVIDFGEMVVRQVVLPRTEIIALSADTPLEEAVCLATRSTVSKFPVFEEDLDHIIGIAHIRDLLAALQSPPSSSCTARELAREALFVPETISVNDLLHQFRARRQHMAIVLDEFGGTAGLVTLEDLLEEIVGDVRDPFDAAPPPIQSLPDGTALIDGLSLITEVNQHFGLHLTDDNYDTIAGFFLGRLGRIPKVGDQVNDPANGITLRVQAMDRLRIARLSLSHQTQHTEVS